MKELVKWVYVAAACCLAQGAGAQAYPAKPIRFIVPWGAGSGTDLMARAFAQELTKAVGQQVVVDNRGGAGATIGTEIAARSPEEFAAFIRAEVTKLTPLIRASGARAE